MKMIHTPTVALVSRQTMEWSNLTDFLEANGLRWEHDAGDGSPAEVVAEAAGRLCYLSYQTPRPGGNAAYLQHIKEVGHGSVLEHTLWTFFISGVSRTLTHELVRHRIGVAYSQLSQRYVDESVAEYVAPRIIAADADLFALWESSIQASHTSYVTLAQRLTANLALPAYAQRWLPKDSTATDRRKCARQAARSVLPNACETKIAFTANARALRHIFDMRAKEAAEPEIRVLAHRLWTIVVHDSPHLFGDYSPHTLPDGTVALTTDHPRV